MRPIEFMTLTVLSFVALAGISQIAFVQSLVSQTGYSSATIFSGIGAILFFFYVLLAVFFVRS